MKKILFLCLMLSFVCFGYANTSTAVTTAPDEKTAIESLQDQGLSYETVRLNADKHLNDRIAAIANANSAGCILIIIEYSDGSVDIIIICAMAK